MVMEFFFFLRKNRRMARDFSLRVESKLLLATSKLFVVL